MYSINLPCKKGAAAVNLFMVQKEPFRIGTLLAYQIEYIQKKMLLLSDLCPKVQFICTQSTYNT